ncbi:MAG: GNAT family N-acetyltransferase [Bacteroidota bacterium]
MITIKRASPDDAALLAEIAIKAFIETHETGVPADSLASYLATKLTDKTIKEELSDIENIFYIIYYDEQPAGYSKIIFNKVYPLIETHSVTKMERLYLLKSFHDLKLGASLFSFNTDVSKNAGQQGMWLYVWKINERAIRFYTKAGFTPIASEDFIISETHSNPNHIMYLKY